MVAASLALIGFRLPAVKYLLDIIYTALYLASIDLTVLHYSEMHKNLWDKQSFWVWHFWFIWNIVWKKKKTLFLRSYKHCQNLCVLDSVKHIFGLGRLNHIFVYYYTTTLFMFGWNRDAKNLWVHFSRLKISLCLSFCMWGSRDPTIPCILNCRDCTIMWFLELQCKQETQRIN